MTKRELIDILKPYADDCKIIPEIEDNSCLYRAKIIGTETNGSSLILKIWTDER